MTTPAAGSNSRSHSDSAAQPGIHDKKPRWIIAVGIVLAVVVRIVAVWQTPQNSYLPDHKDAMAWSAYAAEHGPLSLYDMPKPQPLIVWWRNPRTGAESPQWDVAPHAYNYPPLSAFGFWAQGWLWTVLDNDLITVPHARAQAARLARFGVRPGPPARAIWTLPAQISASVIALLCDFLLAWGVMALVRGLRNGRRARTREAVAFAITLLAPPIFLDSGFWNQYDVWIACPLVWCVAMMVRQRFGWAGLFYGLALMIKPSAILLGPVFVYVFVSLRFMPGGSWARTLGLVKSAVVAIVVCALIGAPFMIHDARSASNTEGPLRWFKRGYVSTIGSKAYQRSTLMAFNIWWLDLIGQGAPRDGGELQRFLDSNVELGGISKAKLGKAALGLSIVLAWVLCGRKWRLKPESWVVCAYVILLAAFALPTGVHERYVYYCIPFLVALAAHEKKWIPPLLAMLIVGTFEMTSFRWVQLFNGRFYAPGNAAYAGSIVLAVLTVLSLLYSFVVLIPRKRDLARV